MWTLVDCEILEEDGRIDAIAIKRKLRSLPVQGWKKTHHRKKNYRHCRS